MTTLQTLGSLLCILGALLRLWSYRTLGRFFTFQLSIREDHRLVTHGPYAYVRHPGYSAIILVFFGGALVLFSPGGWVRECGVGALGIDFGRWVDGCDPVQD
jgi:protein-S-isoprenylcysteine O-methyltransferase Ste14